MTQKQRQNEIENKHSSQPQNSRPTRGGAKKSQRSQTEKESSDRNKLIITPMVAAPDNRLGLWPITFLHTFRTLTQAPMPCQPIVRDKITLRVICMHYHRLYIEQSAINHHNYI